MNRSIYGSSHPRHALVLEKIPATNAPTVATAKLCHVSQFGRSELLVETLSAQPFSASGPCIMIRFTVGCTDTSRVELVRDFADILKDRGSSLGETVESMSTDRFDELSNQHSTTASLQFWAERKPLRLF